MTKRLLMILVMLLWGSNVYAASISDLLGSKKSIKLLCVVEKAEGWLDILDIKDWTPGWKGTELFFEIKEKSFTKSDSFTQIEYLSGITPGYGSGKTKDGKLEPFENEGSIEVNDNYYSLSHSIYMPSDKHYHDMYVQIKINRYSGKFNYSEKEYSGFRKEFEGTCTIVTEQKL